MPSSPSLVERVRSELSVVPGVEEKKMFGSIAFLVNKKMCVAARSERIMCRIDPALHSEALLERGCTAVVMRGRQYLGYVHIQATALETTAALQHWIRLALDHNKHAKRSKAKGA
jgi:TfoX/Sxy family transcriptional regulator of competence genes